MTSTPAPHHLLLDRHIGHYTTLGPTHDDHTYVVWNHEEGHEEGRFTDFRDAIDLMLELAG